MDLGLILLTLFSFLFFLDWVGKLRNTEFNKEDKKKYMRSPEWDIIRTAVKNRDNNQCVVCSSNKRLEAHHITYKRLGNEKLSDLITLCRNCHQAIHDRIGYGYNKEYPV